jgi:hypothetical protein
MTIENTSRTEKLTTELRTAQEQVAMLQERISRMEMLFLQNAAGVSPIKLSTGVLESISSAPMDIVPLTEPGSDQKMRPKTKWADNFRSASRSVDDVDATDRARALKSRSGSGVGTGPSSSSLASTSTQSATDILDILDNALGDSTNDSMVVRPDSDGGSTHEHNSDIAHVDDTATPSPSSVPSPVKKTPLRTVPESEREKEEDELELLDIETIADVIAEHVEGGDPLSEDQIIKALNMAMGRQAIQIPNIGGSSASAPPETTSADSKSPPLLSKASFDPRSGSWSRRGLSKEEKKELKTYAISTQLNHALRISGDVLGAADAHFETAFGKSPEVQNESIEDTLRDIRSADELTIPIKSLESLNRYVRSRGSSPESDMDSAAVVGSSGSLSMDASIPQVVELIAASIGIITGRASPSAYCNQSNREVSDVSLWVGELLYRSDFVMHSLLPTVESLDARHRVFHYLRGVISATLGVQLFPMGSFVSNTYLPGGDIDVTSFLVQQEDESWFVKVNEALCMSSFGSLVGGTPPSSARDASGAAGAYRRVSVKNVAFVNAEVKIVRSEINGVSVDITANQLAAIYAQAFIMKLDDFVGQGHLLKKSILLVKAWCQLESPRFSNGAGCIVGAKDGRLSSWAVVVMLIWIFNMDGNEIRHPLQALGRFLSYYSCFDWNKYAVTVNGLLDAADLSPLKEASDDAAVDINTRNIVRKAVYFPEEVLGHYKNRYSHAKSSSKEAFDAHSPAAGVFIRQFQCALFNVYLHLLHYSSFGGWKQQLCRCFPAGVT